MQDEGKDLMRVVGPENGEVTSGDWVGAVVSLSGGSSKFPALSDALDDGLFGPDCRNRLEPYNPKKHEAEALFCTRLAIAAMERRRTGDTPEHDYLDEEPLIEERREFEKLYSSAQRAERQGALVPALEQCRAALALLERHALFPDAKPTVVRTLKARIRTLENDSRVRTQQQKTKESS
jgi:hypothetical protein